MKKGDQVMTPDGKGTIEGFEGYSRCPNRVLVKLDNNPYWFPIAGYFEQEVKIIEP